MTDIVNRNMNPAEGHIVAMGGGGFSMEPDNPLLDDFVLGLSPRKPARVCFVPTASADSATYIVRFYRAFAGRCIPTDLTLWNTTALPRQPQRTSDLADFIAEQDVIYVGGGDTANLLVLWRRHGTTWAGGAHGKGTVFRLPLSGGRITVLASFDGKNGAGATGSPTICRSGICGVTDRGGADDQGTVFRIALDGGPLTVLASFNDRERASPRSTLTLSPDGSTLLGMVTGGGAAYRAACFRCGAMAKSQRKPISVNISSRLAA